MKFQLLKLALLALLAGAPSLAFAADDWQAQVGQALGKTGSAAPGGIYRVGLPRTDLKVTLDGVELKAGFALGSWLAFEKMGDQGMVMGDLVLTMDEVNPVMAKLVAGGIEITALHNHLLRNQPFTMYMHVQGRGDPVKLAAALHTALAQSKTPLSASPPPATPAPVDLDTAAIDQPWRQGRQQRRCLPVQHPARGTNQGQRHGRAAADGLRQCHQFPAHW